MPSWGEIVSRVNSNESIDDIRREYLKKVSEVTGRNTIAYYSGWLQKPGSTSTSINDDDKNGFMSTIYGLDRSKGLDIILHTPGGETAATESIVDYFRRMFGNNIRAIVPQLAMSGGTMIACSCKEIIMGKQSNLGPIDPQFGGIPAYGVIEEFEKAVEEVQKNPNTIPIWQEVVRKYHPTFIGECEKAIKWSGEIVKKWLETGMFEGEEKAEEKAEKVVEVLNEHKVTKSHARHIHIDECKQMGLKICELEELEDNLQDLILSVHHSFMITFATTTAVKIIENQKGNSYIIA